MPAKKLKGVAIGAGYFSQFQYEAWQRIPEVELIALCDRDAARAQAIQQKYGIARCYTDYREMLDAEKPDFVDVITPPETHLELCRDAAERGIAIICQKALAPTLAECEQIVAIVRAHNVPFMLHENFRWQPWYREIKRILQTGEIGEVFSAYFRMRMGDGWGEDAYLARQPYFRSYPRLLIYETGVHFIDTFRYLFGEIASVYATLRRLNPIIAGEDAGQVIFTFASGATAILDANRYNEAETANPRYTFGEMRIDGCKGHLTLDLSGEIRLKLLGEPAALQPYAHTDKNFAGDCVYALQRHVVDCLLAGRPFETTTSDYLRNMEIVEACYQSAREGKIIPMT